MGSVNTSGTDNVNVSGLNAGELDTPITIYELQEIKPDVGPIKKSWAEVSKCRAKVAPVRYLKAAIYKALTVEGTVEVTVRRKDWITPTHRIGLDGKFHSIKHIETDKRRGSTTMLLSTIDKLDK